MHYLIITFTHDAPLPGKIKPVRHEVRLSRHRLAVDFVMPLGEVRNTEWSSFFPLISRMLLVELGRIGPDDSN